MIITDTFVVIPSLPILIMMTSLMKGSSTVIVMALVLAMFAWAWPSRQIRSMALTIKERDFIHTARFSGESTLQTECNRFRIQFGRSGSVTGKPGFSW